MQRRGVVLVLLAMAAVGAAVTARRLAPPSESGAERAAPPNGYFGAVFAPAAPRVVARLKLPDPVEAPGEVLLDDETASLVRYRTDMDPVDIAGGWTLTLGDAGFRRVADASRAGRTVQRFARPDGEVLLAVGRTVDGAFVSLSIPEEGVADWVTGPDAEAPEALRAVLPPPEAEAESGPP